MKLRKDDVNYESLTLEIKIHLLKAKLKIKAEIVVYIPLYLHNWELSLSPIIHNKITKTICVFIPTQAVNDGFIQGLGPSLNPIAL